MRTLPHSTFKFIFYFVRKQWGIFLFIMFAGGFMGLSESLFPFIIKEFINSLSPSTGNFYEILYEVRYIVILMIAMWVIGEILLRIQGVLAIKSYPKFRAQIREETLQYVRSHSHDYFSQHFSGNLAKKISDLPSSCQAIMETISMNLITAAVGAVVGLILAFHSQWLFSILLVVWLSIHSLIAGWGLRRSHKDWKVFSEALSVLNGKVVDVFSNMMTVRLFSRHTYEKEYLRNFQDIEIQKSKKAMRTVEYMRLGLGVNGLCLMFSMVFLLIYLWSEKLITVGDLTQISMQTFWLFGWAWYITFQLSTFIRETGTVDNCLELIRKKHDLKDKPEAKILLVNNADIEFSHVSFSYLKNQDIFKDLNVYIPAGQKVGLVGISGAGKSTFVNLLLRFYDTTSGTISIDSQNIANVTQGSLREHIAMIPQDPSLFHRTLMENIRYGKLDASDQEVIKAAKLAHCDEFISHLDEGYNTLVGERGVKLSGGQRQRIAIARAILKNAPILVLDEATSSLDSVTEKLIQSSLQSLMEGKTALVVAHRLSTLENMDRIIVFDKGHIIEDGSKDELLKQGGHFYRLWNMQANGFLPEDF